jgi:hypothetical protein
MQITRLPATLSAAFAVLLLLCVYASQGEAASRTVAPYHPKNDPNYTQATANRPAGTWEAVSAQVQAFATLPYAGRRQDVTLSTPLQPPAYTQASAPTVAAPSALDLPIYGGFGPVPYAFYRPPLLGWEPSPRIPWWSVLPLVRHKRH